MSVVLPAWPRGLARSLLDLALPPRCLGCGAVVSDPGALCPSCFSKVTHVTRPHCDQCALPFPGGSTLAAEGRCPACLAHPPAFSRTRAAWIYDEGSAPLVLRFKHADRTDATPAFARWMARAGADLLTEGPVLVPVPLHPKRLWRRRYNQAALLAQAIARRMDLDHRPLALVRARATASQGTRDRQGRLANLKDAFAVARPDAIEGRSVVLIDDVMTTGATLNECARALARAGATRVDALVLARVPLEGA
jgi:ComF family protein